MTRPVESWATVAAQLHRVASDVPDWVSDDAVASKLLAVLRSDALALIEAHGPSEAARRMGVGRATLARWRERGQWLAERRR